MKYPNRWTVGDWTFWECDDHGFTGPEYDGVLLYGFSDLDSYGPTGELYLTLEHAMAAAIAEKHTGHRGAGGTGVGTAADWFMKMLGVYDLKPAGEAGTTALLGAFEASDGFPAVGDRQYIERVEESLGRRGYKIGKVAQ